MAAVVEEIYPSVDELTRIETEIPCHVQGCSKIFLSSSALRMHVIKTHNMFANDVEKRLFSRLNSSSKKSTTKKVFYCPINDCSRSKTSKKPFLKLAHVKQVLSQEQKFFFTRIVIIIKCRHRPPSSFPDSHDSLKHK